MKYLLIFSILWGLVRPVLSFATIPTGIIPDPLVGEQWYLDQVRARAAWEITRGDPHVIVAILDSGVDIDNVDLKPNTWVNPREIEANGVDDDHNGYVDDAHGWDFVKNIPDPRPKFDGEWSTSGMHHGTLIAGIIAARGGNGVGISGVAPLVTILPLRVLDGGGEGDVANVVKAIRYATAAGASVINLSFVGLGENAALTQALRDAWTAGVVIVAAAGNEQQSGPIDLDEHPLAPVCSETGDFVIIGVTAVDEGDHRAVFANTGRRCIDLAAPGTNIFSAELQIDGNNQFPRHFGGWWSGTSLATGIVSGAAALVKSRNLTLTNREIVNRIIAGLDPIPSEHGAVGLGRLNVLRAVIGGAIETVRTVPLKVHGLALGAPAGVSPRVILWESDQARALRNIKVATPAERGGTQLILADLDGDGEPEIVTISTMGGRTVTTAPRVVVQVRTYQGKFIRNFIAWPEKITRDISLAAGDINGDGRPEIIVGTGRGARGMIRVFSGDGQQLLDIPAWPKGTTGGVTIATADMDSDGLSEIFAVVADGSSTELRTFGPNGQLIATTTVGGSIGHVLSLAVGDLDADGQPELVIGSGPSILTSIRILTPTGKLVRVISLADWGRQGVAVSVGDTDSDGINEIVAYPRAGGGRRLSLYNILGKRVRTMSVLATLTSSLSIF